jgi:hypothetical protein
MNSLKRPVKIVLILGFIIVSFSVWEHYRFTKFLNFSERLSANITCESSGLDNICCVKLKTSKERYAFIVKDLKLSSASDYPKFYKEYPANCISVDWWNINFPEKSQHYWLPTKGMKNRTHTAYINGYMYYAYEVN